MSNRDTSIDSRLIESARKEFIEKGFIKAELKTICENAKITTGAVYKRYKGKEELFRAVVEKAVATLDSFVSERTDVDFSSMSDEEVRNTWTMNEEYILAVFQILWDIREEFVLLLEKSAGTVHENFGHDFAYRMTHAYKQYYEEAKKRDIAKAEITDEEMHVLCMIFWTSVYEPFIHEMSWKEIEEHCKVVCRFMDWKNAVGIMD